MPASQAFRLRTHPSIEKRVRTRFPCLAGWASDSCYKCVGWLPWLTRSALERLGAQCAVRILALGCLWGAFGPHLGYLGGALGVIFGALGLPLRAFGASCASECAVRILALGCLWGAFGRPLGYLGRALGMISGALGLPLRAFGASCALGQNAQCAFWPWGVLGVPLGCLGDAFWCLGGASGCLWGACGACRTGFASRCQPAKPVSCSQLAALGPDLAWA